MCWASRRLVRSTGVVPGPAGRRSAPPVAEQPAWRRPRARPVAEGGLAVDDDLLVATCPLHPAPLAGGQVVDDLADPARVHVELLHVVHDDVGGGPFAQDAAVAEPGG